MNTHFKHAACFESFKIVAVFLERKKRCAEKKRNKTKQKYATPGPRAASRPATQGPHGRRRVAASEHEKNELGAAGSTTRWLIGKISAKCCLFWAVSAPIFASKYAFRSIFQNLPDYLIEKFEIWQNFADFATFAKFLLNFHENC